MSFPQWWWVPKRTNSDSTQVNRSSIKRKNWNSHQLWFLVTIEIHNPVANLKTQNKKKIKRMARVENIIAFIENPLNLLSLLCKSPPPATTIIFLWECSFLFCFLTGGRYYFGFTLKVKKNNKHIFVPCSDLVFLPWMHKHISSIKIEYFLLSLIKFYFYFLRIFWQVLVG